MYFLLFDIAGFAIAGWLLMILLPGWRVTQRVVQSTAFPAALCVIYVVGVVALLSRTGLGVIGDFGSAEGVVGLLADADVALVAWIHILAFDHLVGLFIFRDNLLHAVVPLPVQSVLLFVTLMFGPAGFLLYWGVRSLRGHGVAVLSTPEEASAASDGPE